MTTDELREKLLNLKLDLEYFEYQCNSLDRRDLDFLSSNLYFEIKKTYEELTEKLQEKCEHDVWYLLRQDRSFNIVTDTCRCIECGKIRTGREDKFKGKLIGNNKSRFLFNEEDKYNNVRNEFDTNVIVYGKEDSVKRILQKYKFTR